VNEAAKAGPVAGSINWKEWNQEAFLASRREAKPILLALTATWCHWCHVMDQTSYADPRVISLINSRFIPVRVDVDLRPDVSRRYNQGGFPSVAILDGLGNLITGRVYTPPDQMISFLEQVGTGGSTVSLEAEKPSLANTPTAAQRRNGNIQDSPTGRVLQRLEDLYDPDFGGFGREPKQPPWEALRFLMALYSRTRQKNLLGMITTTLDGMRVGLYDRKDQGFYRYSVSRDWSLPHYEKMSVTNANLAIVYFEAYQLTGRRPYRDAAVGALSYLLGPLYNQHQGVFHASQDAGEDFYRLPWKDRDEAAKPAIDHTVYTGWNALAATALIHAFGALGDVHYLKVASDVLERLWRDCWSTDQGLAHVWEGPDRSTNVLEDQVHFLRALLALYQANGCDEHLERAVSVSESIERHFAAPDGGFYDWSRGFETQDELFFREKPVLENSLLSEALMVLALTTGKDEYQALARNTLEVFEGDVPGKCYLGPENSRRMEQDEEQLFLPAGSSWARAWDMLSCGPVRLVVVGPASSPRTKGLLKAALRTYAPHRIVQALDPGRDGDRIESLGFPSKEVPALYACLGSVCLAPITEPKQVRRLLKARPWETP